METEIINNFLHVEPNSNFFDKLEQIIYCIENTILNTDDLLNELKNTINQGYELFSTSDIQKKIDAYKSLLKYAAVPDFWIEHPELLISAKPNQKDIDWAITKIKEYENK